MQLYNGDNKLIFNEMMMMSALYYTKTLSLQKQQSAHIHVAPLGHIIPITIQAVFVFSS
jgi:hypothetical protein